MVKAVAVLWSSEGVSGTIQFTQDGDGPTTVTGNICGLKTGLHGFHVRAPGDTTNGSVCQQGHTSIRLAKSMVLLRMQFVMLVISETSMLVKMELQNLQLLTARSLCGPNSIIGRAVVVHADPHDLGRGGHELSKSTGNAGGRIVCGIIGLQG